LLGCKELVASSHSGKDRSRKSKKKGGGLIFSCKDLRLYSLHGPAYRQAGLREDKGSLVICHWDVLQT
jgi:hypothetical protein